MTAFFIETLKAILVLVAVFGLFYGLFYCMRRGGIVDRMFPNYFWPKKNEYFGKNGIQVKVDKERQIAVVYLFLDGKYQTWVEFNQDQLSNLAVEIEKAKAEIGVE